MHEGPDLRWEKKINHMFYEFVFSYAISRAYNNALLSRISVVRILEKEYAGLMKHIQQSTVRLHAQIKFIDG